MAVVGITARTVTLTLANTAYVLALSPTEFTNQILIKAPSTNPGTVFIGGADVNTTSAGYPIAAGAALGLGDVNIRMYAQDLALHRMYVMAPVVGCTVTLLIQAKVT